jgi:enoyl-CoA hydratase
VPNQTYRTLAYEESGYCRVVHLSLTDDETAAIQAMELCEVCDRIAWDEEARAMVLALSGPANEMGLNDSILSHDVERSSLVEPVAKLRQPVIAAIRGDAIGIALELALACDIRIGTETSRFGLPQVLDGRMPSNGGTQRLPRLIGYARAIKMILTGELMDAEEAKRAGLLSRVVPSDTLMKSAMEMAHDMATRSPLSLSYAKEALYGGRDLTLDQGIRMEMDLYLLLFTTSDRTEGITAFRQKRKPKFEGS